MPNRSPPMPQLMGSTTPSTALAAMAASMAVPPRANTWAPACDASVWLVATIPRSEMTMDRAWLRSCASAGMASITSAINRIWYRDDSRTRGVRESPDGLGRVRLYGLAGRIPGVTAGSAGNQRSIEPNLGGRHTRMDCDAGRKPVSEGRDAVDG